MTDKTIEDYEKVSKELRELISEARGAQKDLKLELIEARKYLKDIVTNTVRELIPTVIRVEVVKNLTKIKPAMDKALNNAVHSVLKEFQEAVAIITGEVDGAPSLKEIVKVTTFANDRLKNLDTTGISDLAAKISNDAGFKNPLINKGTKK